MGKTGGGAERRLRRDKGKGREKSGGAAQAPGDGGGDFHTGPRILRQRIAGRKLSSSASPGHRRHLREKNSFGKCALTENLPHRKRRQRNP